MFWGIGASLFIPGASLASRALGPSLAVRSCSENADCGNDEDGFQPDLQRPGEESRRRPLPVPGYSSHRITPVLPDSIAEAVRLAEASTGANRRIRLQPLPIVSPSPPKGALCPPDLSPGRGGWSRAALRRSESMKEDSRPDQEQPTPAPIPRIDPAAWEQHQGFRETLLRHYTEPEANTTLRRLGALLFNQALECPGGRPDHSEGETHSELRAALADLRHLHGFLFSLGQEHVVWSLSPAD